MEVRAELQLSVTTCELKLKEMLSAFTGLSLTRIQYTDILQSMPDNYLTTWNMLWDYLDAECIDAVLDSIDARIANRLMLDCLIQRHTEDISGFCDILEWIPNTTYELSSIVEFLRGALDVSLESAREFKRELRIRIMGDINVNHDLIASGYENIREYGNAEIVTVAEFEDFEVWILLPPNEQLGLEEYMRSLYNNLQLARTDNNIKLAIYSNFDQLRELCNTHELNALADAFDDALRSLRNLPNKLIEKNINVNDLISSLNAEALRFAIQLKFSEMVSKNGIPIVIAVEMPLDSLWDEYKKSDPSFSYLSPVSFTNEEGQILKTLDVKWTFNSPEVESEVFTKLEERNSFVFYRNGSFSGVSENRREALDIVFHELNRPHYLLIVGDDSDIEEEIQQDIKIVASIAKLKDDQFKSLCKSLEQSSEYKFGNYYSDEAVFTLLLAPEVDQLKEVLHKKLLCSGHTVTVIYSGHAADNNGSWSFPDGSFSANDLMTVVRCAKGHVQHYIKIKIILNCCYGLIFAKQLGNIQMFLAGLEVNLNDSNYKAIDIENFVSSKLTDCTEQSIELNHLIIEKIARKMYNTTDRLITMSESHIGISILPYTVGPLVAQGILYDFLKMPNEEFQDINIFKIRTKSLLHRLPTAVGNNLTPVDPQLIVFPAGNGDSTLFRWHDFNMLVDGGIYYADQPCFWETVRRLPDTQKLDVICVTHSDADHLLGVLRIFEEETLPIKVGKLYTTVPLRPSTNANKSKLRPRGTKLWRRAVHHMKNGSLTSISNLVTDPRTHLVYKEFPNGDILEVFMLTPTKTNLDKAAKLLPFIRISTLDEHNMASASLLIKCSKNANPSQFALLTGDAPSEDIINGLKNVRKYSRIPYFHKRYSLDYVDMPHHGSKNNDPRRFLSKIKARVCLISTNGLKYSHPDNITLQELNNAMTNNNIENLLFTYSNERKGGRDLKTSFTPQENERKCKFADNNPGSKQRSKCLLVTLTSSNECIRVCNNDNIFS